jgi:hypothetical protein
MSEHEALARFHYGCAARHHKVEIRRLWRSRCMMHAQRSPSTGGTLLEAPCLFGWGNAPIFYLIDITIHPAPFLLCLLVLQKWTVRYFWPTMRRWLRLI